MRSGIGRRLLLAGRHTAPLSTDAIRLALNMFLGMEPRVPVRYEEGSPSTFKVGRDEAGQEFGEVVVGPDIYPGPNIVDPNAALSLTGAVAHELQHYHRWRDRTELPLDVQRSLDEALTSLEAIARYSEHLSPHDIRQLVADAANRVRIFSQRP